MAGYIFAVKCNKKEWTSFCDHYIKKGFFTPLTTTVDSLKNSETSRKTKNRILAATFADMITMKPGDNIYFLRKRKIYGIGEAFNINGDCKYDNYLDASSLIPNNLIKTQQYLSDETKTEFRWICLFKPSPFFYTKGVDMDDVLRFRPEAFKMLRAFEKLSFIKIDDNENRALKEYISLVNENIYDNIEKNTFAFDDEYHEDLKERDLKEYTMDISKVLLDEENKDFVYSEMFIESLLLQQLSNGENGIFGKWDYLSHQLIASPFKPVIYIDKIDVFGYRYSDHYNDSPKLITKYLVIELKKDKIDSDAIEQTMQYVDWICKEYASGDYSKIEAYVVGNGTEEKIAEALNNFCQRSFIVESHPVKTSKWNNMRLIKYSLEGKNIFEIIKLDDL